MADLDALLADPQRRPPEGWSARAEAWADDRDSASWRHVAGERRAWARVRAAEGEAHDLACELAASDARVRRAEASLDGLLRAVAA